MSKPKKKSNIIQPTIEALGSWPALFLMAFVSVGWWVELFREGDPLDRAISIWTMLLDVVVLIAFNYFRHKDRKLFKKMEDDLDEIKEMLRGPKAHTRRKKQQPRQH